MEDEQGSIHKEVSLMMKRLVTATIAELSLLVLAVLVCGTARAQESRGTILGRVTDPSGAVVPGATVEVVNVATNVRITSITNGAGEFRVPFLLPGRYSVTVSSTGFKTYVQPNVELRVADALELRVTLAVGDAAETIQVTGETQLLQTAEASQSATISRKVMDEIPIQGGSAMEVLGYAAGINKTGELRTPYPAWNQGLTMLSSNGAGEAHNDITLDGVANSSIGVPGQGGSDSFARPAISLSSYAVEEMKIQTNVYDATQGHTSGAVFNMVSRSGTNELHGEAHYQFYPSSLAAENPFNRSYSFYNSAEQKRYGFSIGGPVYLPKLYDGRNKTFFFFTMEKHPLKAPSSNISTVPTEAERGGDFSALLALDSSYAIYDPLTTTSSTHARTAFPGNVIPASRISAAAKKIMEYISLPNTTTSVSADGQGNFTWIDPGLDRYDTYSTRIDHVFTDKHRLMGRFSWDNWYESASDVFGNGTTGNNQFRKTYVGAFDDVYVFTPNLVLDVKAGFTRQPYDQGPSATGFDYSALGFSSGMVGLVPTADTIFPSINFGGVFTSLGAGGGYYNYNTNATLNGTLSWQKGKHNLRIGAESRVWTQSYQSTYNVNSPDMSFDSSYTNSQLGANSSAVGQDLAAFLLGVPSSASMVKSSPFTASYHWFGLFLHDDWKVTPRLTLNLGVRWELEMPTTERYNRMEIGYDSTAVPSFASAARAAFLANQSTYAATEMLQAFAASNFNVTGGYLYANSSNRGTWKTYWKEFMPRVGLAYRLNDNTVFRGGFGIFYDSLGVGRNFLPIQDGYSRTTSQASSLDGGLSYLNSLDNPFPGGLLEPVGSSLGADLGAGGGIFVGYLNAKEPYSMHWSTGFQRNLPGRVVLDVNYVGSKSVHLTSGDSYSGCSNGTRCHDINAIPRQYLSTSATYDATNSAQLNAYVPNPYAGIAAVINGNGSTTQVAGLLRQYSQFGSIWAITSDGRSWYHSLQTRLERRFHNGFTIAGNFTWERNMQSINYLNATDAAPEHVITGADPGVIFNAITVYELPFGRGRQFGTSWHGVTNWLLGEWQISGTFRTQQGYPASLGDLLLKPGAALRDLNGQRDANNFFNVSVLNTDSEVQPGTHIRTVSTAVSYLRSPGFWMTDGAISKKVTLFERIKGEFRFESYNAANHTNLWNYMSISSANPYGAQYNRRLNGLNRTFEFSLRATF
jgi:hypothetical protein